LFSPEFDEHDHHLKRQLMENCQNPSFMAAEKPFNQALYTIQEPRFDW